MNRKSIALGAVALSIVGATAFVTTSAFAQSTNTDPHTTMIQQLAQKLGISEDKVKTAFDQIHAERETEMKANMETKLNELVTQGKLTEAQKTAVIAKMEEMKTKHQNMIEEMQNLTPEQRKAKMDAERVELENWAKSQGIDLSVLPFFKGGMRMKFIKHGFGEQGMTDHLIIMPSASPSAQ